MLADLLAYWQAHVNEAQMWGVGWAVVYFSCLIYREWRKRGK